MKAANHRLTFPQLRRVNLTNFSLYTQEPNVALPIHRGVTCLAGANGIGKSTFLAAVNYGLTGRVPTTERAYDSADEYYRDSVQFTQSFFDGRIGEDDRATA